MQTYKTINIKSSTFHECCIFFRGANYHAINCLIINSVFVFIILLTEPQKFTFSLSSRKNIELCKPLFWHQRQRPKKVISEKSVVDFAKLLKSIVDIQRFDIKTTFLAPRNLCSQPQYSFPIDCRERD